MNDAAVDWQARALAAEARVIELETLLEERRTKHRDRMRMVRAREKVMRAQRAEDVRAQNPGSTTITRLLGKQPRCDLSIAGEEQHRPGSGPLVFELLVVMNRTLGQLYEDYRPVRGDNIASVEAAQDFEAVGLDPAWAAAELRRQCVLFNRGKHGRGELPRTLKYFRRGLLAAWRREQAGQQMELPLVSVQPPIVPQRSNTAERRPVPVVLPTPPAPENNEVTAERTYQPGSCDWRTILAEAGVRVRVA